MYVCGKKRKRNRERRREREKERRKRKKERTFTKLIFREIPDISATSILQCVSYHSSVGISFIPDQ